MNIPLVTIGVVERGNDAAYGWVDDYPFYFWAGYWGWGFEVWDAHVWDAHTELPPRRDEKRRKPRADEMPRWETRGDMGSLTLGFEEGTMRNLIFQCAARFSSDRDWESPEPMDSPYVYASIGAGSVIIMEW